MSVTDRFNPSAHGLLPHYGDGARFAIKKHIHDDWRQVNLKLPSYMSLVARAITPSGVPEEWLSKLSHQTMGKMLSGQSTPRYPVWACLHLYLITKHGSITLEPSKVAAELLAQALKSYGTVAPLDDIAGTHWLSEFLTIELEGIEGRPFAFASVTQTALASGSFQIPMTRTFEGIAIRKSEDSAVHMLVVRDVKTLKIETMPFIHDSEARS